MDLLGDLLAHGKTSRLYCKLVHDRRIATDVAAVQSSHELSSVFQIVATAAPGHGLRELEGVITTELRRLSEDGPEPAELERSVAQAEAQFVYRLQTVGGFGGKSDQLNTYNVFLNDPGYFPRDLGRYTAATADRVRQVAASFLDPQRRVTLSVVPHGQGALAIPGSTPVSVA